MNQNIGTFEEGKIIKIENDAFCVTTKIQVNSSQYVTDCVL